MLLPYSSMPQPIPQLDVIPLSQAINKYFDLSVYFLVLMGFGTIASTGMLDWPTIVLVGSALAVRGYLLAERRRIVFSERWTTPLTIAYFIFYAGDYFVFSRSFLTATVHLVLFAVVVRTFSLRRDRDYTTLAILAFLMVLASAVLTVDSVFLLFFAGFTLMAVATFVLMEMRRSGRAAAFQARHSQDAQEHRHLAFSLARITPALVMMILLGAAGMFFLLPRMSAGYLGGYSFGTDISTGFSDRVQLGRIGQIQQSDAVVMHIQIDGDQRGQYALHWRGVALTTFNGQDWSNPHTPYGLQRQADGGFTIPFFIQGVAPPALLQTRANLNRNLIHYRVLMEPIGTNVFFLAPWARRVTGAYRALQVDAGGAVSDVDTQRSVNIYEADSDISRPSAGQLREAGELLPKFALSYLQLPELDARIPRLAVQITASSSNNYDKAVALEGYLQSHYGYTLQLPRVPVADPLANFLFERRQGHCEYFASSMAVMLRTLRIPSRVVNGFRSEEFNDLSGNYVVRAKNAHAWVEAYFPGYGWVTFDPTPGGAVGSPQGWGRAMLYLDAAASFWREWVVSYDASHQYILGQSVLSGTRTSWERARMWARLRYARLMNLARKSQRGVEHSPGRWLGAGLAVTGLLLVLANIARIARMIRTRGLRAHPERSPDQAAVMWYERMARYLAQRGVRKTTSQTAQEFVRVIEEGRLRTQVGKFTDAYESARFGNSPDDAVRLPELYEAVEAATRK
ncbi:MAG: protein-glutamine gamma-glutamyltransferase [Acidobacteriaceae bacterium]|jgi:transglutaminase-like putative cysteine protease|nr:protein-glutamine gamma-glutamyltransferase [Acidobacteriaceae bacterium]